MELFELVNMVSELCAFYERQKEPKQATIELWFKMVKNIPSEPILWITQRIKETHEVFPKNIPATLWGSYTEWQRVNPDKKAIENYFDCPDCNEGLIFATKKKNDLKYRYVFRCVKCKQNHCRAYPLSSPMGLKEDGYDVIPKEGNLKSTNKKDSNLSDLVKSIIHPVDRKSQDYTDDQIPF